MRIRDRFSTDELRSRQFRVFVPDDVSTCTSIYKNPLLLTNHLYHVQVSDLMAVLEMSDLEKLAHYFAALVPRLNLTTVASSVGLRTGARDAGGNWSGLVGVLQRDEADWVPMPLRTDAIDTMDIPFATGPTVAPGKCCDWLAKLCSLLIG